MMVLLSWRHLPFGSDSWGAPVGYIVLLSWRHLPFGSDSWGAPVGYDGPAVVTSLAVWKRFLRVTSRIWLSCCRDVMRGRPARRRSLTIPHCWNLSTKPEYCVATAQWSTPAWIIPIARRRSFSFSLDIALRPLSTEINILFRFPAYQTMTWHFAKSTTTGTVKCLANCAKHQAKILSGFQFTQIFRLRSLFFYVSYIYLRRCVAQLGSISVGSGSQSTCTKVCRIGSNWSNWLKAGPGHTHTHTHIYIYILQCVGVCTWQADYTLGRGPLGAGPNLGAIGPIGVRPALYIYIYIYTFQST